MNYLITGGCGFIGSNYINNLFSNKCFKNYKFRCNVLLCINI